MPVVVVTFADAVVDAFVVKVAAVVVIDAVIIDDVVGQKLNTRLPLSKHQKQ